MHKANLRPQSMLLLTFSCLLLSGCGRDNLLQDTSEATRDKILQVVPIGTSISSAESLMESAGFECKESHNKKYASFDKQGRQITHGPTDFLYCDSGERIHAPITKRWQVVFLNTESEVTDVSVSVGLTGP